jgi:hypothetical protein
MSINELHTTSRCLFSRATLIKCSERKSLDQRSTLRKTMSHRRGPVPMTMVESVSLDDLLTANEVTDHLDGIDVARQALANSAKLMA